MLSLSKAVEYPGDPAHVAAALAGGGCDPCGRDAFGLTALHKFSAWDKVDLITLLLPHLDDADARLNERAGEHGWTPLHAAAEMGAARAAEALLALPAVRPDVTDDRLGPATAEHARLARRGAREARRSLDRLRAARASSHCGELFARAAELFAPRAVL